MNLVMGMESVEEMVRLMDRKRGPALKRREWVHSEHSEHEKKLVKQVSRQTAPPIFTSALALPSG